MSVFVTVRVAADPAKAEAYAAANAAFIQGISQEGKRRGAIHHRFFATDGEMMVFDEWESAEAFQKFFSENTDIPAVMAAAGATGAPEIKIWRVADMKDEF